MNSIRTDGKYPFSAFVLSDRWLIVRFLGHKLCQDVPKMANDPLMIALAVHIGGHPYATLSTIILPC